MLRKLELFLEFLNIKLKTSSNGIEVRVGVLTFIGAGIRDDSSSNPFHTVIVQCLNETSKLTVAHKGGSLIITTTLSSKHNEMLFFTRFVLIGSNANRFSFFSREHITDSLSDCFLNFFLVSATHELDNISKTEDTRLEKLKIFSFVSFGNFLANHSFKVLQFLFFFTRSLKISRLTIEFLQVFKLFFCQNLARIITKTSHFFAPWQWLR